MGRGWADIHMVKGVFVRFGFDAIRISQIQRQVKNKATGTPHEVYYIQPSLASDGSIVRCQECFLYIYTGVGAFGVARFDWQGNAKAFTLWNE